MTDIDEAFLAERERIREPWKHVVNLGERFCLLMGPPADKAILADAFRTQPALIAEIRRLWAWQKEVAALTGDRWEHADNDAVRRLLRLIACGLAPGVTLADALPQIEGYLRGQTLTKP